MENPNIATLPEVSPHLATTPVRWKRILVAIDFGDQSLRGLEEAITIARCFHSELLLVHAASPAVYSTGMEPIAVDPIGLQLGFAREEMDRLLKGNPALKELQHREFVEYGNPMQLIHDIAIEHNVDLIVAGSHTTSSLERLLLGSVAESVLRTVNCPVLIIGPHAHTEATPFRSILLAAPLADTGLRCAQFACSLAEQFPARLTLLHVLKARSPLPAQALLTEENARMELARLEPDDLIGKVQTIVRVEYGDAAEVIPSVANSIEASLVVAGVSDRSPLGDHAPWSTLSHIIRDATCPVLCVQRHLA